jgi:hypothetical protein
MVITCPNPDCRKQWDIDDAFAGKRVSCQACKTAFVVPGPVSQAEPDPTPYTTSAEDDDSTEDSRRPSQAAVSAQAGGPRRAPTPPGMPPIPARPAGPPSVPTGSGGKRVPGGGGSPPPPPLPPPPPPPGGAGNNINLVMSALVRAMSIQKVEYFILGLIVLSLVGGLPVLLLLALSAAARSYVLVGVSTLAAVVLGTGLLGVLAGGMAHLADMDERGRKAGIGSAFGFWVSRFVSLFMGAVLFAAVIVVVLVAVNGLILLLNRGGTAGSFLAALLFVPQLVLNLGMVIALLVWVLVPIAIATENIPALQAIRRLQTCLCHDAGRLFVHFAVSVVVGIVILLVLAALLGPALGVTSLTNSSLSSMLSDPSMASLMMGHGSSGGYSLGPDMLRAFFGGLVVLVIVGYLSAYWVGSFTGYYKDALRRNFGPLPPPPPPPYIIVTCPNPTCGKKLRVSVAFAGKRVSCPSCSKPVIVPPLPPPPLPGVVSGPAFPS